jgi:hypothetical protein
MLVDQNPIMFHLYKLPLDCQTFEWVRREVFIATTHNSQHKLFFYIRTNATCAYEFLKNVASL